MGTQQQADGDLGPGPEKSNLAGPILLQGPVTRTRKATRRKQSRCSYCAARTDATRLAGFGQRAATRGITSSISWRVWDSISSSPRAAGRRMNLDPPPAT